MHFRKVQLTCSILELNILILSKIGIDLFLIIMVRDNDYAWQYMNVIVFRRQNIFGRILKIHIVVYTIQSK